MAKRFATHTDEEIKEKRSKTIPENTQKANKKAANILRAYLKEKKQEEDFENFDSVKLNEVLSHFYLDARKSDGELYKTSSLENFRHSLNRYLNAPPFDKNVDIIKGQGFMDANQCFKTAMNELKASGKGATDHYPCISDDDLRKMYSSVHMNPDTPMGLFNKVHFELRLYFCRRGGENILEMTKSTFSVGTDPSTGAKFVKKTQDELTKNRREREKEGYTGIMPADNTPLCPVASYENYIRKLNPNLDRLWQRPLDSFTDSSDVWFCNRPVGKDTLGKFMPLLSKKCALSQIYTNHSIRTTGVTILTRRNFSAAQIMSLTGHKSVSSLAIYHRVSDEEKVQMGQAITSAVRGNNMLALPSSTSTSLDLDTLNLPAIQTSETGAAADSQSEKGREIVDFNDFDLNQLFDDFPDENINPGSTNTVNMSEYSSVRYVQSQRNLPMFSSCKIGNINITFNVQK